MKRLLALVMLVALSAPMVAQSSAPEDLSKEIKISKSQAMRNALKQVPNGTFNHSELIRSDGRVVWSFYITGAKSRAPVNVLVDAKTGKIVKPTPKPKSAPSGAQLPQKA